MATWTLAEGTRVHSGGIVAGGGPIADELRRRLAHGNQHVYLVAPPDGDVRLDVTSDYHLDQWVRAAAGNLRAEPVHTEYVLNEADLPPEDQAFLKEYATWEPLQDGEIG